MTSALNLNTLRQLLALLEGEGAYTGPAPQGLTLRRGQVMSVDSANSATVSVGGSTIPGVGWIGSAPVVGPCVLASQPPLLWILGNLGGSGAPTAPGAGPTPNMLIFDFPGPLVISTSDLFVSPGFYTLTHIGISLFAPGSANIVFNINYQGRVLETVTMSYTASPYYGSLQSIIEMRPKDTLQIAVTTPGTGASGMTVSFS
jgi:hypothetical protein